MMSNDEFLKKWLEGDMGHEKRPDGFFDNEDQSKKVNDAMDMSSVLSVPEGISKEQAWEALEVKLNKKDTDVKTAQVIPLYRKKRFSLLAVAASIIMLVGFYFIFNQRNDAIFETGYAETLEVHLPDNSTVTLNADSKISFNADNWNEHRVVRLEGEAFFEVQKGNTFAVISSDKVVEVLGTSFNIKARKDHYQVACFTGEVVVKVAAEAVTLKKGEATNYVHKSLINPHAFERKKIKGWQIGKFYFDKVELSNVFKEFERQYDVTLNYDTDIAARIYTGYFSNKNIEEALQLMCDPMRLSYKDHGNGLITIK